MSEPESLVDEIVGDIPSNNTADTSENVLVDESPDGLKVSIRTYKQIETAKAALEHAGIDQVVWEPERVRINSYQVTLGAKSTDSGKPEKRQMIAISVVCKRRFRDSIVDAIDELAKRVHKRSYKLPAIRKRKQKADASTLVVGLVDNHFGKLCWGPEVGSNYDLKLAAELYARAIRSSVEHCKAGNITKAILPIGNDFLHVDNRMLQTEQGTPQDFDGRFQKMLQVAEEAIVSAVSELRAVCPVECIHVPGNHDRTTSMLLARCVHWAFHGDKHVTVDTSPCPVKVRQFGECMLLFAHGDGPKIKHLIEMMPVKWADEWARSKRCREILTGHLHQEKRIERIGTHEEAGVKARILPSLSGTDWWHFTSGYSLSQKATQNLLYSHDYGMTAIYSESAEQLLS